MNHLLNPNNRLFELARSGRRLPHVVLAVVLSFVFILLAQLSGGTVAALILLLPALLETPVPFDDPERLLELLLPDTAIEQTAFLILAFGPIFFILWGWLALFEKRSLVTIGLERSGAWTKYLRGLLIGLAMFAGSIGISAMFGYITVEQGTAAQPQGLRALGGVLLVLLGWTVQGSAEEALTRGWLLPVVGARHRPWLGLLISSLIFSVFHLLNPNLNPVAVLNLFLFGFFAAVYALYEGGIWGVCGIHVVWNWAQGNLFGFEVSGQAAPGGTLFNLAEVGPDIITGGAFGPEGGLSVTIILLIGGAIVLLLSRRQAVR